MTPEHRGGKPTAMMAAPSPPARPATHTHGPRAWLTKALADAPATVMGVLNVTPDSFSDGGYFLEPAKAVAQARRMADEGAGILDIGAESTRPYGGMQPVSADEEISRLESILPAAIGIGVPVSLDTMKAKVAAWGLDRGVAMINDVWGLHRDPDMAKVVAERGVPVVIMHNRDTADAQIDIMADMDAFFCKSLEIAARAGIADDAIILDPGVGFGKTPQQSLEVLRHLGQLAHFGAPLLVGASRKRFIDAVSPATPDKRLGGSIASHLWAVQNGARIVRAHDVAETVQALRLMQAIAHYP